MRISAKEEYGLRCLLQLASQPVEHPMTVAQVAEREGLTLQYAAKMMYFLRKARFIRSYRGMKGGFVLMKPASDIYVWEVLEKLSGPIYDKTFCGKFSGTKEACVHVGNCGLRPVWVSIVSHLQGALSRVSLAELLQGERASSDGVEAHFLEVGNARRASYANPQ